MFRPLIGHHQVIQAHEQNICYCYQSDPVGMLKLVVSESVCSEAQVLCAIVFLYVLYRVYIKQKYYVPSTMNTY
jgi:hypothetical protein